MPVTYNDVLGVADRLADQASEACQRSAVSRYFYAGLHGANHWLNLTPGMPSAGGATGGMHTEVAAKLRCLDRSMTTPEQKTKGRVLAAKLEILKQRRVQADYVLNGTLTPHEIRAQQAEATAFVAACAEL